jgi:RHS repeat-associated protein
MMSTELRAFRWALFAALSFVALFGGTPAGAQQCEQIGGTCKTINGSDFNTCPAGTAVDGASCGANEVCCLSTVCEQRAANARCADGVSCPVGTDQLGDAGCGSGKTCCTRVTIGPSCGALLGHLNGHCSDVPNSCPNGFTNVGATPDCESCCNPIGMPTPTPPPPAQGGGTYKVEFMHTDALGSVRMVTDQAGDVVSRRDYYPFGETINASVNGRSTIPTYSSSEEARQRFTGKERDTESGLDYFGARYYSGSMGRFTSADPQNAGARPSAPQSWNGYSYALNNPNKFVDPDGKSATLILGLIGALAGGADAWAQGGDATAITKGIAMGGLGGAVAGSVIDTFGGSAVALGAAGALGATVANETDAAIDGRTPSAGERAALATQTGLAGAALGMIGPGQTTIARTSGTIEPQQVRFTQNSISSSFKQGGTVGGLAEGLKVGAVSAEKVPAIRVVEMNGKLYSLDNRRLEAFRRAGVSPRFEVIPLNQAEKELSWKFTTKNDGESVRVKP